MVVLSLAKEILKCKIKVFRMSSIDMQHLTAPKEKQKWATKYRMLTFCQRKEKKKRMSTEHSAILSSSLVSHNLWPFNPKTYYAQYLFQQP